MRARSPPTHEHRERGAVIEPRAGWRAVAEGLAEGAAGAEPWQPARACGATRVRTSEGDLRDARPQRAHGGRRGAMRRVAQAEPALAVAAKALDRPVVQQRARVVPWHAPRQRGAHEERAVSRHASTNQPTHERQERERRQSGRRDRAPSTRAAAEEGLAEGAAPGQQACARGATRVRTSEGDLRDARPQRAHGGRRGAMRRVAQAETALAVEAKALDRLVIQQRARVGHWHAPRRRGAHEGREVSRHTSAQAAPRTSVDSASAEIER